MFTVICKNHENNSKPAKFSRDTMSKALWSVDLMKQCGYQTVIVKGPKNEIIYDENGTLHNTLSYNTMLN